MGIKDLSVEDSKAVISAPINHVDESDFAHVGLSMKHGFRGKHSTDGDSIDTPDKFTIGPDFPTVSPPLVEDLCVYADEVFADPVVAGWAETGAHHFREGGIDSKLVIASFKCAPERAGWLYALDWKEASASRAEEFNLVGFFVGCHGKPTLSVGGPEDFWSQFAPGQS